MHPIPAWRQDSGAVTLHKETRDSSPLQLPCGGCLGCRTSTAQAWALRCHLELERHERAAFATLTYSEENLPLTLEKDHVSDFVRRLRRQIAREDRKDKRKPARDVRFFAAGEYGERTQRPHYHAILYGIGEEALPAIDHAWQQGFTTVTRITPARIAYTAGYCQKKIGWRANEQEERIDPHTGEVYQWQPPFRLMSRNPGIGAHARRYTDSWRDLAISNGSKMPVPRYLHKAWRDLASEQDIAELELERAQRPRQENNNARREAAEQIAKARQAIRASNRT